MFLWYIFLLVNLTNVESARILAVFPSPAKSHQNVFQPIIKSLIERGHHVVFVTTAHVYTNEDAPKNYKEINLHEIYFSNWHDELEKTKEGSSNTLQSQINFSAHLVLDLFERQFNNEKMKNILDGEEFQFDLILTESYIQVALIFSYIYQVPLIQISSAGYSIGDQQVIGAPIQPLLYPELINQKHYNLTIFEKYSLLRYELTIRQINLIFETKCNTLVKKLRKDAPDLTVLKNNIHLLLLNTHTILDDKRPAPLSVRFIYGVHQKTLEKLPKDLQSFLDESTKGIIYISFGSNVTPSQLQFEKIEIMLKVLSQMPYKVLWKWDKDEMPGRPENVRIGKWFPQADLLKHPNIKLFITQAGMQSTDEAIAAGVPLIGIPILFDQWMNAGKYVRHGIGVKLDMKTLTNEEFTLAITKVIEDESYRNNIIKLRDTFYDQPMQPLNHTVWWIEYVLRHNGAKHLRAPAANMSWNEFFEIDLFLLALSLIILIFVLICTILYVLYRCIFYFW